MTTNPFEAAYQTARATKLNAHLITLAAWAVKRASEPHDVDTTLTMLGRRCDSIRKAVKKAGEKSCERTGVSSL